MNHTSFFTLALVSVAFAQAQPVFGKLEWSMTPAQAKAVYAGFETVPETYGFRVRKVDVKVAIVDIVVEAVRGSATITNITLETADINDRIKDPANKRDLNTTKREIAFTDFKDLLVEKYGAPTSEDRTTEGETTTTRLVWKLPLTLVSLVRSESRYQYSGPSGYLLVAYKAVDRNNPM